VSGAVSFTAYGGPGIWYTARTDASDGMVSVGRGAKVVGQRARGGVLFGRAVLYADDMLEGDDKEPDQDVGALQIPCSKLSLDWDGGAAPADTADSDDEPEITGDGTYWKSRRGPTLELFASPTTKARSVTVRALSCSGEGCLWVESIEAKTGWRKVIAANEAMVVGWVRANQLVRVPDGTAVGYSYGCHGHHGVPRSDGPRPTTLPVPVRITRGTKIYAQPKVGPWAEVLVEDGFMARYAPGDAWARVTYIPGVREGSAWVPVDALLPASP